MNKKILALAVSGLFLSTTAMADGKSWEGFKIGVGIGGQSSHAKDTTDASHDFNATHSYTTPSSSTAVETPTNGFVSGNGHSNLQNLTNSALDTTASLSDNGHTSYWTGTDQSSLPTGFVEGTNIYNRNYTASETFQGSGFSSNDLSNSNVFGTIEAGYDWQLNDSIVVGLNASYNISSKHRANGTGGGQNNAGWTESYTYNVINNTNTCDCGGAGTGGHTYSSAGSNTSTGGATAYSNSHSATSQVGINSSTETGNSFDFGGRIGYLANKDTLIFLSGGASAIKAKQNMTYASNATLGSANSALGSTGEGNSYSFTETMANSSTRWGYYIGGGIETRFTDNISAKLEYRYADYGTMSNSVNNNATLTDGGSNVLAFYDGIAGTYSLSHHTDLTTQSIRAVVSYGF